MTIFYHRTNDMFSMYQIADYFVNPTNICGYMDKGISLEFIKRFPKLKELYFKAIDAKKLSVGKLQILRKKDLYYSAINLPTKYHYIDPLSDDNLIKSLGCLNDVFLHQTKNIVLPLLGQDFSEEIDFTKTVTLAKADTTKYGKTIPFFNDMFEESSSNFHICISPNKTNILPRYLVLYPLYFEKITETTGKYIKETLDKGLTKFNLTLNDFDKMLIPSKKTDIGNIIYGCIPETHTNKIFEVVSHTGRIAPEHFKSLFMSYIGTHFILLSDNTHTTPYSKTLQKVIDNHNNLDKLKEIDKKVIYTP